MKYFLDLQISGEEIDFEKAYDLAALIADSKDNTFEKQNVYICRKGAVHYNRLTGRSKLYEKDVFSMIMDLSDDMSVSDALDEFAELFMPYKDYIHSIRQYRAVDIWLSVHMDSEHEMIRISDEAISKLASLGLGFNLSIASLHDIAR